MCVCVCVFPIITAVWGLALGSFVFLSHGHNQDTYLRENWFKEPSNLCQEPKACIAEVPGRG